MVKVPSPLARIWKSESRIQETEEDSTLVTLQWSRTEPPAQDTVNIMEAGLVFKLETRVCFRYIVNQCRNSGAVLRE